MFPDCSNNLLCMIQSFTYQIMQKTDLGKNILKVIVVIRVEILQIAEKISTNIWELMLNKNCKYCIIYLLSVITKTYKRYKIQC